MYISSHILIVFLSVIQVFLDADKGNLGPNDNHLLQKTIKKTSSTMFLIVEQPLISHFNIFFFSPP